MEVDNITDYSSTPGGDRRKSGRMTRRPQVFSQSAHSTNEATASMKRKIDDARDGNDDDNLLDSESDDTVDDEADEEELRAELRAARSSRSKKSTTRKGPRAAKKPKVASNGTGRQLAFRPAPNGRLPTSRPRKPKARPSLAAGEKGLFGKCT